MVGYRSCENEPHSIQFQCIIKCLCFVATASSFCCTAISMRAYLAIRICVFGRICTFAFTDALISVRKNFKRPINLFYTTLAYIQYGGACYQGTLKRRFSTTIRFKRTKRCSSEETTSIMLQFQTEI